MSRLESLVSFCGRRVYGEAAKPILVKCFQAGCHVVLRGRCLDVPPCDIPTCLITCRKSFCVAGAIRFQKMSCSFRTWQAQHFGDFHRHFAWQAQHFRRVALRSLHSTLYTPHFTLYTLYTLHYTLYTVDFTLYTLHSTLYIPHSTHDTPDSLPYTSHAILYTLHSILYTTFYTPHCTLYTPHSTLYTPHSTIYTLHSTLCTPPSSAFHSLQCTGTVTGEKCRLFK